SRFWRKKRGRLAELPGLPAPAHVAERDADQHCDERQDHYAPETHGNLSRPSVNVLAGPLDRRGLLREPLDLAEEGLQIAPSPGRIRRARRKPARAEIALAIDEHLHVGRRRLVAPAVHREIATKQPVGRGRLSGAFDHEWEIGRPVSELS